MKREEFEQRTGFYPSESFYSIIEKHYAEFAGDKDAFCDAYKNNKEGLATKIQWEADMQEVNIQRTAEKTVEKYESRIAELEKTLEYEQDWRPWDGADNVQQADYVNLASQCDTKQMSDEQAKDLLYNWYGFARDKIKICHNVPVYEVNRHRLLRKVGELDRPPLYNATDWNYIRFDCGCMGYELYNDNLRLYQ